MVWKWRPGGDVDDHESLHQAVVGLLGDQLGQLLRLGGADHAVGPVRDVGGPAADAVERIAAALIRLQRHAAATAAVTLGIALQRREPHHQLIAVPSQAAGVVQQQLAQLLGGDVLDDSAALWRPFRRLGRLIVPLALGRVPGCILGPDGVLPLLGQEVAHGGAVLGRKLGVDGAQGGHGALDRSRLL